MSEYRDQMSQKQTFSLKLSEFCREKQTEVSRVRWCDAAVCEKARQKRRDGTERSQIYEAPAELHIEY